jgi:hypothetical protein
LANDFSVCWRRKAAATPFFITLRMTNSGAGFPPAPISFSTGTVAVLVRHSVACKLKQRRAEVKFLAKWVLS